VSAKQVYGSLDFQARHTLGLGCQSYALSGNPLIIKELTQKDMPKSVNFFLQSVKILYAMRVILDDRKDGQIHSVIEN